MIHDQGTEFEIWFELMLFVLLNVLKIARLVLSRMVWVMTKELMCYQTSWTCALIHRCKGLFLQKHKNEEHISL